MLLSKLAVFRLQVDCRLNLVFMLMMEIQMTMLVVCNFTATAL